MGSKSQFVIANIDIAQTKKQEKSQQVKDFNAHNLHCSAARNSIRHDYEYDIDMIEDENVSANDDESMIDGINTDNEFENGLQSTSKKGRRKGRISKKKRFETKYSR